MLVLSLTNSMMLSKYKLSQYHHLKNGENNSLTSKLSKLRDIKFLAQHLGHTRHSRNKTLGINPAKPHHTHTHITNNDPMNRATFMYSFFITTPWMISSSSMALNTVYSLMTSKCVSSICTYSLNFYIQLLPDISSRY